MAVAHSAVSSARGFEGAAPGRAGAARRRARADRRLADSCTSRKIVAGVEGPGDTHFDHAVAIPVVSAISRRSLADPSTDAFSNSPSIVVRGRPSAENNVR